MMNRYFKIHIGMISVMFFLILVSATVSLSADTVAEIGLKVERQQEENILTVHINLTENPGIAGLMFYFIYDQEVLEVISVSDSILPSPVINDLEKGYIGYAFAEVQDYKETGAILSVTFQVLDSAGLQDCTLSLDKLDACNADLETVSVISTGGAVGELLKEEDFLNSGTEKRKWISAVICILASTAAAGGIGWMVQRKRKYNKQGD